LRSQITPAAIVAAIAPEIGDAQNTMRSGRGRSAAS
jgi:hypothetical protein